MKSIPIIIIMFLCYHVIHAQQTIQNSEFKIQNCLDEIEANNTSLDALRKQAEAQKTGSRTGIYLPNPEVEFNYLWGSSAEVGDRKDLNIMQSFDFPTAYYYKSKIAGGLASQAELQYAVERKSLLLQARKVCIDMVYRNALKTELDKRLQHAQQIANAYQTKFDMGEANVLEYNKAQLNLLNARKESESNDIEREALSAELARLNGGKPVSLTDAAFEPYLLPTEFEQWYTEAEANNPALQYLSQGIEISQRQEQLNRAMNLPKFSAGYRSERILGTTLQGVGVGISIPLWAGKNTVKHAKAQTAALQSAQTDARTQFYNSLKTQYDKTQSLQRLAADYRKTLQTVNSGDLLQTALNKGQLSLIEYMMEQTLYYDAVNRTLETERDMQQVAAELRQWQKM